MIHLRDVTKHYRVGGVETWVARGITLTIPPGLSVALLGRNGAGKSSLLRLIAGTMIPSSGQIWTEGHLSWPVGFSGSFHGELTGAENVRFLARVYGADDDALLAYVAEFSELGRHLYLPFRTYSSGMRSRLAFGASLGLSFDYYLVDEVTSVGDAAFRAKSEAVLSERLRSSGAIIVSHGLALLERICDAGAVLEDGRLTWYDDVSEAISHHRKLVGQPKTP
ncbi:MAG: ABC transporter ATP-binding protein [Pseudomonadota bacterium]